MSRSAPNESLSAYLDGELNEAEAAALEAELDANAELRAELDSIEGVVKLLRNHGSVSAPDDFHAKVMAAAEAEAPVVTWWAWLRRPFGIPMEGLAVAVAAAAVLFLAVPKGNNGDANGPDAAPGVNAPKQVTQDGVGDEGINPEADGDAALTQSKGDPQRKETANQKKGLPVPKAVPTGVDEAPQGEAEGLNADEMTDKLVTGEEPVGYDENPDANLLKSIGFSYTLYTDDPDTLIGLIRTAQDHNGTLTGLDNEPLSNIEIPATGERRVVAHLPFSALGAFKKDLSRMGNMRTVKNTELIRGDTVNVEVTVIKTGGAPQQAAPPKNATRKNRVQQDDMMEASDVLE